VLLLASLVAPVGPAAGLLRHASAVRPSLPAPNFPGRPPAGWALVDADTGRVIASGGARVALPPASLSKVLTALVVVAALRPDTPVRVSARAAAAPPSRIGMKAGQTWRTEDALRAMLISSANDAAMALAERAGGGSLAAFQTRLAQVAQRLGLADRPVLRDPAGLDDATSVGGGNRISARDLAIVARAALAQPRIAAIVQTQEYRFTSPDGVKHRLVNHNKLLRTYRGLVGIKTGYTLRAGGCLLTAARKNGRTVVAVVLGVVDIYGSSRALLDLGFSVRPRDEPRGDVMPRVTSLTAASAPSATRAGGGTKAPRVRRSAPVAPAPSPTAPSQKAASRYQ
jgi:D-alanyl-D-alanine carboxypeptidase (penicillin-binding protein 5/6)